MREVAYRRFTSECQGRMEAGAPHIDIGTPWTVTDARHRIRKLPGYFFLRFDGWDGCVYDINNKLVKQYEGGLWPELHVDKISGKQNGWPRWRLEEMRDGMPGHEFERQIRCIALSEAMAVFTQHIDRCMRMGEGVEMIEQNIGGIRIAYRFPDPSWRTIFSGVDLAVEKKDTADDTAFYTGAVETGIKQPLELRRGKMEAPDIIRNMVEIVRRYPMHLGFRTESNAQQMYLVQLCREPGLLEAMGASKEEAARIKVIPHHTHSNKSAPGLGIRSMSTDFERGRWVIPCIDGICSDVVQDWVDGLRHYDPTAHPDDMLMASWLFWEQCRGMGGRTEWQKFGIFVPT
jgi:hypothetical protein